MPRNGKLIKAKFSIKESPAELKRMIINRPFEIVQRAADASTGTVSRYVEQVAVGYAPWHEGTTLHAIEARKPNSRTQPTWRRMAKRQIQVNRRHFRERGYYPYYIEFGWNDVPTGYPWLQKVPDASLAGAGAIWNREMRRRMATSTFAFGVR